MPPSSISKHNNVAYYLVNLVKGKLRVRKTMFKVTLVSNK